MAKGNVLVIGNSGVGKATLINALKAIPGINLAAGVINAVIAGLIVAALGEGSIYAFEQIYLGNKSLADIDWVKKIIESKLGSGIIELAVPTLKNLPSNPSKKDIADAVMKLIKEAREKE